MYIYFTVSEKFESSYIESKIKKKFFFFFERVLFYNIRVCIIITSFFFKYCNVKE